MRANVASRRWLPKTLFFLVLAVIALTILFALLQNSDWQIPEGAKSLNNPLAPSQEAVQAARDLYGDKCANCHGDTGKGDGPDAKKYKPAPTDLRDLKRINSQSDGELFYKITNGKRPMPPFKKRLTDEQRWQLVLLLRAFTAKSE